MASSAFSGVGTTFGRADQASSTPSGFTTIAEINSISGPNLSRDTIDVTSLDSVGGYREFITSFRDGGEVTLEMNFTLAGFEAMRDDFNSDDVWEYRITLNNTEGTQIDFDAYVTGIGIDIPMDDKVTSNVTLKITGQIRINS